MEFEQKPYSSRVHVTPAASLNVKTFISSSSTATDDNKNLSNGKPFDERDEEFERNFLRAVDRALGTAHKDEDDLIQPVYDIPTKIDDSDMNLVQMTEHALSSFNNSNFFTVKKPNFNSNRSELFLFSRMTRRKMVVRI
jgi:hypothetical protein